MKFLLRLSQASGGIKKVGSVAGSEKKIQKDYPRPNLSAPSGTRTRVESMLRVHAQTWEASIIPLDQWRRGVQNGLQSEYIYYIKICSDSLLLFRMGSLYRLSPTLPVL